MSAKPAYEELEQRVRELEKKTAHLKITEQSLRESKEKYGNILKSIEDGYFEVDIAGNFTFFNDSMCKILGYHADELMGMNNREYMDEENSKKVFQVFNDVFRTGIAKKAFDWKLYKKDGSQCFVEASVSLIKGSNGRGIGFRGIVRDITERKRLEENLQQALKMEAIGTLTGGIAHDFNNILGIILGNAELALDDVPSWNLAHSSLEEIKTAGLRAKDIVRQLLSFSRKADHELIPVKVVPVIRDALKFLRSTIPTTIDIRQNIQAKEETVLADPTQINQIMMNLCINASHAMEQTGGNLTINVNKITLDENSAGVFPDLKQGNYVRLTVSDTGPGIDSQIIDRIFDPYFTTKEVGKGSGMGLAVVHGIVKNLGGAISVDSKPGKGAAFNILLPLIVEESGVDIKTKEDLPFGKETILFVDDEKSIVLLVQQMLKRLGYQVETKMSPAEALELFRLRPDRFDLVITDMTMPQMTGVVLSEKLKEIRREIPVIVCTGYSDLIDEEKVKELGIAAYIMKPVSMREIAKTIRKVLDKKPVP